MQQHNAYGYVKLCTDIDALCTADPLWRREIIGYSVCGKPIWALHHSNNPSMLINASHHANEWMTSLVLMQWLLQTTPSYAVTIVPMVNPDGVSLVTGELNPNSCFFQRAKSITKNIPFPAGWKANANGVDLNLNYPAGWECACAIKKASGVDGPAARDFPGIAPLSEPETSALATLSKRGYQRSLSLHSQGGEIYWNYGNCTRTYSGDETLRKATLHLLGDRYGYIPSVVLSSYAAEMSGFSMIQGIYGNRAGEMMLTISAAANATAYEMLAGSRGCVAVYNYETGEILCLASAPSYDPDHMPDVEQDLSGQYEGVYVNRPVAASYTPGSVFKLVTSVAAIECIDDLEQRVFHCDGAFDLNGQSVNCMNIHGDIGFGDALAKSCNVVFGMLAVELGEAVLTNYVEQLGIEESIPVDGLITKAGYFDINNASDWDIAWAGIGQYTNLINPVQFMTFVGAIANGGRAANPYLVEKVDGSYQAVTAYGDRIMQKETADQLAEWMIASVQNVYGVWNFPDVLIGAKSGTAELSDETLPHATFAGFIQDERYPLAFVVVVENAGAGSETCIPIIDAVLGMCMQEIDR